MFITLGVAVPLWNVLRFFLFSIVSTSLLSTVWAQAMACRAGHRVRSGLALELKPRPFTRCSLLAEEDRADGKAAALVTIVVALLLAADISMELGSDTTVVPKDIRVSSAYGESIDQLLQPISRRYAGLTSDEVVIQENFTYTTTIRYDLDLIINGTDIGSACEGTYSRLNRLMLEGKHPTERILKTDNPDSWVNTGESGGCRWYSGAAGQSIIVGSQFVFYFPGLDGIVGTAASRSDLTRMAVEMAMDPYLAEDIRTTSRYRVPVIMHTIDEPMFHVDCRKIDNDANWNISCLDNPDEQEFVQRHDAGAQDLEAVALRESEKVVDFGAKTGELAFGKELSYEVYPSSDTRRRIRMDRVVYGTGEGASWAGGGIAAFDQEAMTVCLRALTGPNKSMEWTCRARSWETRLELTRALTALHITVQRRGSFEDLYRRWKEGDPERSETRVVWIWQHPSMDEALLKYPTRVVARLGPSFVAGATVHAVVALLGIAVWATYRLSDKAGVEGPRALDLDATRRILAMSGQTRFNCGKVATGKLTTAVVKTSETTCHLQTWFKGKSDPVEIVDLRNAPQVLLGMRGHGDRAKVVKNAGRQESSSQAPGGKEGRSRTAERSDRLV